MEKINTSFGEFTIGEEVVVTMYGLCNRKYVYKGIVEGKRECMGRDYLIMKGDDNYLYDISTINAASIVTGEEAKKVWAKEQESKQNPSEHENKEGSVKTKQQQAQVQQSRYNRV